MINLNRADIKRHRAKYVAGQKCSAVEQANIVRHYASHEFADATIKILCIIPDESTRLWFESTFMNKYQCLYPLGSNQIYFGKDIGTKHIYTKDIAYVFEHGVRATTRRGKREKGVVQNILGYREYETITRNREFDPIVTVIKECKGIVYGMRKKQAYELWTYIKNMNKNPVYHGDIFLDILKYRVNHSI